MKPVFEARGLAKRFQGVIALNDVDVAQGEGETLGMIGPNGSGKTTFINAVTGHLRLDAGTVLFGGRDITGVSTHEAALAGLVRTYQAVRVFAACSVRANLDTAGLMLCRGGSIVDTDECRALLEWLRLDKLLDARAGKLTLFEQRRLELAMRLIIRPRLVMLDEPVGGLAPNEIRAMMQVLGELKARCNLFVIEHTMRVIRELADRVVVLISGNKLADGPPAEILKDQRVIDQYLGTAHA